MKRLLLTTLLLALGANAAIAQPRIDLRTELNNEFWPPMWFLVVGNAGDEALEVEEIAIAPPFYQVWNHDRAFAVAAGEEEWVGIDHIPGEEWPAVVAITVSSNDPDRPEAEIVVDLPVPPRIVVRIDENGVNISNEGGAPLRFAIEIEVVAEPDGNDENIRWITVDPSEGTLEPGEDVDIIVTLDQVGLIGGEYEAVLHINSNDPDNPRVDVDIFFSVLGIAVQAIEWDADAGFPEIIDFNGAFPDMFERESYAVPVTFRNPGTAVLVVEQIAANNEAFRAEPNGFELAPRRELEVDFIFSPPEEGEYQAAMLIESNDPNGNPLRIPLRGIALRRDPIQPLPEQFEETLFAGEVAEIEASLFNNGDEPRRLALEVEQVREPDGQQDTIEWLSVAPDRGEVEPDGEFVFTLTLDARDAVDGDYEGILHILTNDPNDPDIEVAVLMHVFEMDGPFIAYGWPEAWGFPDVIDFNRRFGDIIPDFPCTLAVRVWNGGTRPWRLLDAFSDNDFFRVEPEEMELAPSERRLLSVIFQSDEAGLHEGTLIFVGRERWLNAEIPAQARVTNLRPPRFGSDPAPGERPIYFGITREDREEDDRWVTRTILLENSEAQGAARLWWSVAERPRLIWIEPPEGLIAPRGETQVSLNIDPRDFPREALPMDAELVLRTSDPQAPEVRFNLRFYHRIESLFRDWPPFDAEDNHSILITDFTFHGEWVDPDWEIGIFTPRGQMAGWMQMNDNGPPWGVAAFGGDNYFRNGEPMDFRAYDPHSRIEYRCQPEIIEGPANYGENDFTMLSLDAVTGRQGIPLRPGWNLISLNVVPPEEFWRREEGPDMVRLLAQLGDRLLLVKDEWGRFYSPRFGFNNILFWNLTEGYQMKMSEAAELVITGEPIPPDADIPIARGWNIIAYFPVYQLEMSAPEFRAISPILDFVLLTKDDLGRFANPRLRFSNMPPWQPGKGYQIKVSENCVLNYPGARRMMAKNVNVRDDCDVHYQPVEMTGRNMSVLIDGRWKMENGTCEIGAFTKEGLCVGAASFRTLHSAFRIGIAVWGDDPTTEEIDGALEGESLTFKVWDGAEENLLAVDWAEGKGVYETDGFGLGNLTTEDTESTEIPERYALYEPFPNPFNSATTIRFDLPEAGAVNVVIYDLRGQLVDQVVDGRLTAGTHRVVWRAGELPAGVYVIRLSTGDLARSAKVVLIR
ncbi:MAG: T9SS type A sorting domain-containing protein [Calditrichaeota bacterium]|nr:T9SS type A sorting domain-containing protein [Calditrichota bacterium]